MFLDLSSSHLGQPRAGFVTTASTVLFRGPPAVWRAQTTTVLQLSVQPQTGGVPLVPIIIRRPIPVLPACLVRIPLRQELPSLNRVSLVLLVLLGIVLGCQHVWGVLQAPILPLLEPQNPVPVHLVVLDHSQVLLEQMYQALALLVAQDLTLLLVEQALVLLVVQGPTQAPLQPLIQTPVPLAVLDHTQLQLGQVHVLPVVPDSILPLVAQDIVFLVLRGPFQTLWEAVHQKIVLPVILGNMRVTRGLAFALPVQPIRGPPLGTAHAQLMWGTTIWMPMQI